MPLQDKKYSKIGHRPDYFLLALVFVLTIFGLVMLASASSNLGKTQFNDSYYYIRHQIYYGLSVGILGFILGYSMYYGRLKKLALPLLIVGIIALTLVFTRFGLTIRNTSRWLKLGPISFEPAEIIKLAFVVYLAAWLANPKLKRAVNFAEGLLPFALVSGFIAVLLLLQPATSTVAILLGTGIAVYFLSGAELKYILTVILVAVVGLGIVIYATPYRKARIMGFFNLSGNTEGQNYQVNQALISIGSGGLTGVGYGRSASKASLLPAPTDDSIFAVIAEELGFVGAGSLVALFAILTLRLFWLARKVRDNFGKLILFGFGTIIALQSLTNMAAISGLIPLTGVPLPFISYGGTALAVFLTMSGIAANISKYA
jgi:cell division protein FtsW